MLEKKFKSFSIVVNGENLSNVKQTKYQSVVLAPFNNPTFKPVWEPLEGMVINLAVRIKIY